jgi:hypothetical protein
VGRKGGAVEKELLMTTQVGEFNALYADLVDGTISEAEFRPIAVANFAYRDQQPLPVQSA